VIARLLGLDRELASVAAREHPDQALSPDRLLPQCGRIMIGCFGNLDFGRNFSDGHMLRRRDFISLFGGTAGALLVPRDVRAQASPKVWHVGIVVEGMRSPAYDGFLQGMSDLGYVAGTNYLIDWRFADGRYLRILEAVGDFTKLNIDLIFVGSPAMIYPVRQATHSIPIVMGYSTDPVGNGFVPNLAHPGGNITGLASSGEDTSVRQLALLAAAVPKLARVGLIQNPESSSYSSTLTSMQAAAQAAGVDLLPLDARVPQDIDVAFEALGREHVGALAVSSDRFFLTQQQRFADLALKYRLPSIFTERSFVEAGGLMSLGESLKGFYRRAATYVDRIFKGARPGDLPVEQLSLLDLVVNRKTAAALGVRLPVPGELAEYEVIE
jgi:putative tryptophan/tyrosine transport system substrate-binding protein